MPHAQAVTPPGFPSCTAQISSPVLASYSGGSHGIPGSSATYTGSDKVYAIDGTVQVVQCFCTDDGKGIQSNWWKASSLSDADIKVLLSQGWIYIANGLAWGLSDAGYVVQNVEFACLGRGGGSVLGLSTTTKGVLGLATTGNPPSPYNLFFAGMVIAVFGLHIYLTERKLV